MAEINLNPAKPKLEGLVLGLVGKLLVFAFGIFCGIGLVYKTVKHDTQVPTPTLTAYTTRIEELKRENEELKQRLGSSIVVTPIARVEPAVTIPGKEYPKPQQGVVIPR